MHAINIQASVSDVIFNIWLMFCFQSVAKK